MNIMNIYVGLCQLSLKAYVDAFCYQINCISPTYGDKTKVFAETLYCTFIVYLKDKKFPKKHNNIQCKSSITNILSIEIYIEMCRKVIYFCIFSTEDCKSLYTHR